MTPDEFEAYYKEKFPLACYFARKYLNDSDTVTGVAQEALLSAWQKEGLTPNGSRNWIETVIKNQCLKYLKAYMRRNTDPVDFSVGAIDFGTAQSAEDEFFASWESGEIWRQIDKLPPTLRDVLVLHYDFELGDKDVAAKIGISVTAAAGRLYRGKQALRKRLLEIECE